MKPIYHVRLKKNKGDAMIAIIDNYDSFTYNLVQYFGELGVTVEVFRNDEVTISDLVLMAPTQIVISPGPGNPGDAGVSKQVIQELGPRIPTLGVCLGHQCIGEVFGGVVTHAPRLMHGKTSPIYHYGEDLFDGLPSPFEATRYHSLIVAEPVPNCLKITAFTKEGEVMGLRHRDHPIFGVQFHPESFLTGEGMNLLTNFLNIDLPTPSPHLETFPVRDSNLTTSFRKGGHHA